MKNDSIFAQSIILGLWQEIVGTLKNVDIDRDYVTLLISCEKLMKIQISRKQIKDETILKHEDIRNKLISILRTESDYHIIDYDQSRA